MRRLGVLPLLLLAGCSLGGSAAALERSELDRLVLQPDDLPAAFVRFDHGRQLIADAPGGRRADATRFRRTGGWKARYRRTTGAAAGGPLVIESRADLFEAASGAEDDLDAAREDLEERPSEWKPIDDPGLGDESFAAAFVQRGVTVVRHYEVFWRRDNATASLKADGFEDKLSLADVLELARKQDRRIADAAD
jgi:hypothetical protein